MLERIFKCYCPLLSIEFTYLQWYDETVHDSGCEGFHSRLDGLVTQTNSRERGANFLCCTYRTDEEETEPIKENMQ